MRVIYKKVDSSKSLVDNKNDFNTNTQHLAIWIPGRLDLQVE